jgi:glycerate dehydrogenase
MKAVLLDWETMGPGLDVTALQALLPNLEIYGDTTPQQTIERVRGAVVVLGNKVGLRRNVFEACPEIRFIGLTATGTDNVDIDAAREKGIAVANIRAYCTQSVVEHVFGCMLNLTHALGHYSTDVRGGAWSDAENFCLLTYPMQELSAMTLGLVGYGELARGVERIARTFNMEVIISARPGSEEIPAGRVSFTELVESADVISLHCPLKDVTRGLFGAEQFRAMKKSAILINTARGGLVDSAALADALRRGEIAAAAIDVLPQEPPVNGDPLLDYEGDNLMVTPHIAWGTLQARQNAIDELTANVRAFLEGERRNRVD